jgi:hypothetical protein
VLPETAHLFVEHLPKAVGRLDIFEMFEDIECPVAACRIVRSSGDELRRDLEHPYCFVELRKPEQLSTALTRLTGRTLFGKNIFAKPVMRRDEKARVEARRRARIEREQMAGQPPPLTPDSITARR